MASTKPSEKAAGDGTKPSSTPSARNPKDSMKSTWRTADRSTWKIWHHLVDRLNLHPEDLDVKAPVHAKTEKVPYVPDWQPHVWILGSSLPALFIHQAYASITGKNLGFFGAFMWYMVNFAIMGINQMQQMRRIGNKYGYLDGDKHDRDSIPDVAVGKVFMSLHLTTLTRAAMLVFCSYKPGMTPLQANWLMLPLEAGIYPIILDFWFYWYHRVMHEYDSLWQYHRTHHLTKHPNPLLTLYADEEQEFFDMVGIPIMTFMTMKLLGFPMSMYEWWICANYVQFVELAGHSGLRILSTPQSIFTPVLRYFGCELAIEDHDLHHRSGWRKSHNYGKQTRLWDRLFGTLADRIETNNENVDYENTATIFVGIPILQDL